MEHSKQLLKKFMQEDGDNENMEALIIAIKKSKISEEHKDYSKKTSSRSGLEELALKSTKFYKEKIGLSPSDFLKTRNIYERLGQFDYQNPDYTDDIIEENGVNKFGIKRIYIGQTKAGTKVWDGIGIAVWSSGDIHEGYWKEAMRNGPGRNIWPNGEYYVGDWKDNNQHGHGTKYYDNGDKYTGDWRDNKWNGHGTRYYNNGDKYTGDWRDSKWNGHGTEYIANGDRYTGEFKDDKRHGQGTYYWANGSKAALEYKDGELIE